MGFSAYVGSPAGRRTWCVGIRAFASRRGLPISFSDDRWTDDDTCVAFGRLGSGCGPDLVYGGGGSSTGDWTSPRIRLAFASDGTVAVAVPSASPQQVYHARIPGGTVIADDLRLFPFLGFERVDERAALALYQYGFVPPPFTLFAGVDRALGGHVSRCGANGKTTADLMAPEIADDDGRDRRPAEWTARELDASLADETTPALLFFSGGVDSGLLAARLKHLRRPALLLNYVFGPDDREAQLAMRMAAHLGFPCRQVRHSPVVAGEVLGRAADDYAYPFGDVSVAPTNCLVRAAHDHVPSGTTAVEGTGADGAFGLAARYPVWQRAYWMPRSTRSQAGRLFRRLQLWGRSSDLSRLAAFLGRSALLPLELAVLAQNSLDGVAYHTSPLVRQELAEAMTRPYVPLLQRHGPEATLSLLDVVHVCAGRMAAKSFDPLRTDGLRPLYPFLGPRLLLGALSLPRTVTCAGGEGKAVLKSLLAQWVPAGWVYRPKSGFTPPYREMFGAPPFQDRFRGVVLDPSNPLHGTFDAGQVREMVDAARRGQALLPGVLDFLWVLAFTTAWLMGTIDSARRVR